MTSTGPQPIIARRATDLTGIALFERVVSLCGLSPMLGPGTVRRALRDAGYEADRATIADYLHALPQIRARIGVYIRPEELPARMQSLIDFLR